jgi:putative NADH-flavin reductase
VYLIAVACSQIGSYLKIQMAVVALVGASGNFGHKLVPTLADDARISEVRCLSRESIKEPGNAKIKYYRVDYTEPASLDNALKGCNVLVNAMGTNGDYLRNRVQLVDAAARTGVKVYFPRSNRLKTRVDP